GRIVHGSLRPHHLTLSRGAKVVISGWAWLRSWGIPAFGDPVSTSVYNPPEHDGQAAIDGRADVYALGAIAYRALTGVFPDVSRDLIDNTEPLGEAIEKMLAPDPRERASAAEVVSDLTPLRERRRAQSHAGSNRVSVTVVDATEKQTALAEAERTDLDPTALNIAAVAPELEPTDLEALDKTNMLDISERRSESKVAIITNTPDASPSGRTRVAAVALKRVARTRTPSRGSAQLFVAGPSALTTIVDVEAIEPVAADPDATRVVHMNDVT
ncbi:MAG TPA: hypothetical protein VGM39_04545, partial [Kofleriaceae bacterium]